MLKRVAAFGLLALAMPRDALPQAPPAGRIVGTVTVSRDGQPLKDASGAIVYVLGLEEPPPGEVAAITQKGRTFQPPLTAITVGQDVTFPNADAIYHNVFSLSPARPFDLGQLRHGEGGRRRFPKAGVVEVFCNIHPEMSATILVLPNRRFARARPDGSFTIPDLPPGTYTVYAYDRLALAPVHTKVTVAPAGDAQVQLSLVQTKSGFTHLNKYGEPYRDPTRYPR